MGLLAVCILLLSLAVLAFSFDSDRLVHLYDVVQEVWPDSSVVGGTFSVNGQLHSPGEPWPSTLIPLESLFMNLGSSVAITLMNSSWTGPAESTTYLREVPVYLQVSTIALPGQDLYVQSCFASPSPNPSDKSRYALILNKGCATKKSVIKFVSRQSDLIKIILNTSSLKLSTIYLHCNVVLSRSAVTQLTKSCNFDQANSSWVELGGQTEVCDCCATKCKGLPSSGLLQDSKAVVSTGPLYIKEQGETQPSWSTPLSSSASHAGASARSSGALVMTGTSSRASVSDKASRFSQTAVADMTSVSQNLGDALSHFLPGLWMVRPNPFLEIGFSIPRTNDMAKVDWSHPNGGPTEKWISESPSMKSPIVKPQLADLNETYMSDTPALTGPTPQEELRGDVFMNYKWPQMDALWESTDGQAMPLQNGEAPEKINGDTVAEKVTEEFAKPDSVKHSKLAFSQASDGSSSLSYEVVEQNIHMLDKGAKKTRLEFAEGGNAGEERPKKLEKEVQSLLDMLRGLNKMVTGH